ncbi:MAG: hypothetical protein ACAH35_04280 [Candidatus Paceibacterota bacterium]
MKRILSPKRGASLLIMLLLLSVVGVMVLAGSRALLESGRASAVLSTRDEALDTANIGIQEGLSYIGAGSLTDGEYGNRTDKTSVGTTYTLYPLRRGFTRDASGFCSVQTSAQTLAASTADRTCPYYDMAIRNRVAYTSAPAAVLSSRDIPSGTAVLIPFRSNFASFTVGVGVSVKYAICTSSTVCEAEQTPAGAFSVVGRNDARYLRLVFTYVAGPSSITLLNLSSTSGQTVMGKGYTTVDVTGYSGETRVRLIHTVRAGIPYLSETTGVFDENGVLK